MTPNSLSSRFSSGTALLVSLGFILCLLELMKTTSASYCRSGTVSCHDGKSCWVTQNKTSNTPVPNDCKCCKGYPYSPYGECLRARWRIVIHFLILQTLEGILLSSCGTSNTSVLHSCLVERPDSIRIQAREAHTFVLFSTLESRDKNMVWAAATAFLLQDFFSSDTIIGPLVKSLLLSKSFLWWDIFSLQDSSLIHF